MSLSPAHPQGDKATWKHEFQEAGVLGASLEAAYSNQQVHQQAGCDISVVTSA